MKLIVGLGNPGDKHSGNRHNVGFMAADAIAERFSFQPWRRRFSGELAEGRIGVDKCLLLKPSTYMNESGRSVGEALRFYKLDLADVVVIYDEIDLAPGRLKVKSGGGNAGHNGLRSLSNHIGNDYQRVRIGVGRPAQKSQVANYVLRDFSKADQDWLQPLLNAVSAAMPVLLKDGGGAFTSDVASRLAPIDAKAKKAGGGKAQNRQPKPKPGQSKPDQTKTGQSKPESAKPKPVRPKPDQKKTDQKNEPQGPLAALLGKWKKTQQDKD